MSYYRISEHRPPQSWVHEKCDPGLAGLAEKLKEGEGRQQSLRRYRRADGELSACKRKYSVFEISIKRKISFKHSMNLTKWEGGIKVQFHYYNIINFIFEIMHFFAITFPKYFRHINCQKVQTTLLFFFRNFLSIV